MAAHWHQVKKQQTWSEFRAYYSSVEARLESEYKIKKFTGHIEHPQSDFLEIFRITYSIASKAGKRPRVRRERENTEADYHDASLLLTLNSLKQIAREKGDIPPIGLTFDNVLYETVIGLSQARENFSPSIMKLHYWIKRVSAVLGPLINKALKKEMIFSVIDWAFSIPQKLNPIEYYFDALFVKLELTNIDTSTLKELFMQSENYAIFTEATSNNEDEKAENQIMAFMFSAPSIELLKVVDHEMGEKIDLRARMNIMRENTEIEIARRKDAEAKAEVYEKMAKERIVININIDGLEQTNQAIIVSILNDIRRIDEKYVDENLLPLLKEKMTKKEAIDKLTKAKDDLESKRIKIGKAQIITSLLDAGIKLIGVVQSAGIL